MKAKTFDTLELKRQVQGRLREKNASLTEEEHRAAPETWLRDGDDALARLWRRAQHRRPARGTPPRA